MTTNQHATVTGEAEAAPTACGCRNGDPAASLAIQRQLVERAIERDPVAVGELFDRYAEDVYGYVLAWTREVEVAEQLTERVFHDVLGWLPVMQQGDGELAAWLIAMARDAVAHGPHARPASIDATDAAQAISLLDDPEREVVVFRLLLGHSLLHSAHLAGYRPRVAKALQFIACSTLWRNSVDPAAASAAAAASGEWAAAQSRDGADPPPYYLDPKHDRRRADEFEQRLNEPWGASAAKGDPELDNAMTVASTLRLAAPNVVAPPDPAFLNRVRAELMADVGGQASPEPSSPVPTRAARKEGSHTRGGFLAMLASTRRLQLVAVLAALVVGVTAAVVVSASLSGPRSKCGSGGCLASATTGTGPSAVLGGTPTPTQALPFVASSSTSAGSSTTAATAPPTTRARASVTTGAPDTTAKPTTTRRATTTTAKPTTTTTEPPTTTTTTTPPPAPGLLAGILDLLGG
ncbi:MAG TPA: hypothetical protein VF486_07005 [Actinomycetes bacterium]